MRVWKITFGDFVSMPYDIKNVTAATIDVAIKKAAKIFDDEEAEDKTGTTGIKKIFKAELIAETDD